MPTFAKSAHDRAVSDQFTRQAAGFAKGPELHSQDVLALIIEAAAVDARVRAIDLACGTGSVACAMAEHAAHVIGLDATPAMLDQARALARARSLSNIEWREGSIYAAPYGNELFDVVTCRFAFHHLKEPPRAFGEMVRLAAPGGRIVLCDGVASDEAAKAEAFNAMERWRDPSTIAFRTCAYLSNLFVAAGLGKPRVQLFHVSYLAADLVNASFPKGDDRAGLLSLIEASVEGDVLGMKANLSGEGVRVSYPSVVLSVTKPSDTLA